MAICISSSFARQRRRFHAPCHLTYLTFCQQGGRGPFHDGLRRATRCPQAGPKTAPRHPKMAKMALKWPHDDPGWSQDGSRALCPRPLPSSLPPHRMLLTPPTLLLQLDSLLKERSSKTCDKSTELLRNY